MKEQKLLFKETTIEEELKEVASEERKCVECYKEMEKGEEAWIDVKHSFIHCKDCWEEMEEVDSQ